jgi:hypothetical protein
MLQNGSRLGLVPFEERPLIGLYATGALAAGLKRCVEGDVAEEIEGVGVRLARRLCEILEVDATVGEPLDDLGALSMVPPSGPKISWVGA